MICKNCGREITPASTFGYRHVDDQMLTCFGNNGKPLKSESGDRFKADPKEEK